jgi:glycosyltransferase involved in cell wall biosynthesis
LTLDEMASYMAQLPDEPFLLFVGAFGRHKGVDVLLKAYQGLRNAPPLVLIGYETADYTLPKVEVGSRVVALKAWPHAAVMMAWQRSLFGVIPSVCPDACPTVALEAMAYGRPVVASDIGGLPDLVSDGGTGLLVRSDDAAALRQGLQRMLDDPEMRTRMEGAALARVTRFEAGAVIPRIEAIYGRLLAAGNSAHV